MKKVDAVFEGGGVKGIGLAGAVSVIEEEYTFENLAGTSAGAIMAVLLAVGYSGKDIKEILKGLDYNQFKDEGFIDKFGAPGKAISIALEYGIYEGDFFENWLENLLKAKGKTTFGDVRTQYQEEKYRYKVQIIASDLTDKRMLILPQDLKPLGYDPDKFSLSRGVRMSMSIPIFFEPVKLPDASGKNHLIVDGGILSNYPVWLLDDGSPNPPWPTFGFKLVEPHQKDEVKSKKDPINNPISFIKAMMTTMMDAHDKYHISSSRGDYDRTIGIPVMVGEGDDQVEIKTTDFDITPEQSEMLFENGVTNARKFLEKWDFERWKRKYRNGSG